MRKILGNQGLTVIEVLLAVTILCLIVGIVYFSLAKLNSKQALDKGAQIVSSVLNEARSLTLSAKDDSQYGVYLDTSSVVLFKGVTYSSSDPENVSTALDSRVGISNISLSGGGASVVFARLTGATTQYGSLRVYLQSASTTYKTINITSTGIISIN